MSFANSNSNLNPTHQNWAPMYYECISDASPTVSNKSGSRDALFAQGLIIISWSHQSLNAYLIESRYLPIENKGK